MANFFTKAFQGIVQKGLGALPKLNGSTFYPLEGFFGYNLGKRDYTKYVGAYSNNPLVYMIVHKIAITMASIDRVVVNPDTKETVQNSKLMDLLESPNEYQGYIEFMEEAAEYILTTGNLFIRYVEGIGMGQELIIYNSARMSIKLDKQGNPVSWIFKDAQGTEHPIPLEEILHIKTSNIVDVSNGAFYFGLSPLEAAWCLVKSSDEIFSAEASIFKNRGIIGILTNDTDVPMLKDERKRLQDQFDSEAGGAERFNKLKITNTKMRYIQTGMSPTDLKLLEGIMNKLRLLCSVFGMPSVLFNDNASSTYNNIVEAKQSAFNEVYIPLGNKIDKELSLFLAKKLAVNEKVEIDLTSIEVIKASTNEVSQALNNMSPLLANEVINSLTINEIRELAGLEGIDDGDVTREQSGSGPNLNVTV